MITKNNTYEGASFTYEGEKATANGDYRVENGNLVNTSVSGNYNNGMSDNNVPFSAYRDASGNVSINGVPFDKLTEVAAVVETIFAEIDELVKG